MIGGLHDHEDGELSPECQGCYDELTGRYPCDPCRTRLPRLFITALMLAALVTTTFAGLTTATPAPAHAAAKNTPAEVAMWRAINQSRRAEGLAPLRMSIHLTKPARGWAQQMDRRERLYHNPKMKYQVRIPWTRLAENVGRYKYGSNQAAAVKRLHAAFMKSPGHRNNILGNHNVVGVGISTSGGVMWVTVNFAKLA